MADKLLPCPFCGGEADIKDGDIIAGHQYHMAYCYSCGARSVPCSSEEGAIEAWNNRPSPWHTGTPTEEGDYLVAVSYFPMLGVDYQINRFLLEPYNGFIYQLAGEGGKIVAWQKITPYQGENE